jgi:hypothetical protein
MVGCRLPQIHCTRSDEFLYGYGSFILDPEPGGKKGKKKNPTCLGQYSIKDGDENEGYNGPYR